MGEGECGPSTEKQPRKSRHRKKHFYNMILQQMEFYFSDSNLSKDRFLSQLLKESPYIDIDVFLKFNKIRKLNCSAEDIKKAIKKSQLIDISEDGLKLCRKTPPKVKDNVDFCTIYVENIKSDANHETLSQIFSDFGNVAYVSIPKYKHNRANKGFAFIEYETEEQANEALSFFNSIGCKMPSEKNPEELQSIVTFEDINAISESVDSEVNSNESNRKRKLSCEEKDNEKKQNGDETLEEKANPDNSKDNVLDLNEDSTQSPSNNKRKRKNSIDENTDNKKLKIDTESIISEELTNIAEEQLSINEEDRQAITQDMNDNEETKKKKKNKKEKRKMYIKELGMQVLLKKEWKKLRNRYLDLQKKKMKEFKQYLNKQKFSRKAYNSNEIIENSNGDNLTEEQPFEAVNKLAFTPGVIVKVILSEPCEDAKKLKNEIKTMSSEIKFVDIPLPVGSEELFVRFSNEEAAKEFCTNDFEKKVILTGDEEKSYWEKIDTDKTVKFKKMAKKQRGRDKLLKKAEKLQTKHLRFEENE